MSAMNQITPDADKHVWTSAFERLGDENRMVTRCLNHPDTRPMVSYDWPTSDQLAEHVEKHEAELVK